MLCCFIVDPISATNCISRFCPCENVCLPQRTPLVIAKGLSCCRDRWGNSRMSSRPLYLRTESCYECCGKCLYHHESIKERACLTRHGTLNFSRACGVNPPPSALDLSISVYPPAPGAEPSPAPSPLQSPNAVKSPSGEFAAASRLRRTVMAAALGSQVSKQHQPPSMHRSHSMAHVPSAERQSLSSHRSATSPLSAQSPTAASQRIAVQSSLDPPRASDGLSSPTDLASPGTQIAAPVSVASAYHLPHSRRMSAPLVALNVPSASDSLSRIPESSWISDSKTPAGLAPLAAQRAGATRPAPLEVGNLRGVGGPTIRPISADQEETANSATAPSSSHLIRASSSGSGGPRPPVTVISSNLQSTSGRLETSISSDENSSDSESSESSAASMALTAGPLRSVVEARDRVTEPNSSQNGSPSTVPLLLQVRQLETQNAILQSFIADLRKDGHTSAQSQQTAELTAKVGIPLWVLQACCNVDASPCQVSSLQRECKRLQSLHSSAQSELADALELIQTLTSQADVVTLPAVPTADNHGTTDRRTAALSGPHERGSGTPGQLVPDMASARVRSQANKAQLAEVNEQLLRSQRECLELSRTVRMLQEHLASVSKTNAVKVTAGNRPDVKSSIFSALGSLFLSSNIEPVRSESNASASTSFHQVPASVPGAESGVSLPVLAPSGLSVSTASVSTPNVLAMPAVGGMNSELIVSSAQQPKEVDVAPDPHLQDLNHVRSLLAVRI